MKSVLSFIIFVGLACCLYGESNVCNVFSIPYNREMEDCFTQTPKSTLSPPFATILKVLKTKDGLPYKEDEVIDFYRNHYESLGWKNITRKDNKQSLEFKITVYDQEAERSQIHATGKLSIWLAPNDGMLRTAIPPKIAL